MKLKRLLLTVLCAVVSVGAWAQDWTNVTSTYITNAALTDAYSTSTNSAWPVYTTGRTGKTQHPKDWYLHTNGTTNHNVNTTFFECWAASQGVKKWMLFQDVTLPAGRYQLGAYFSTNENRGIIQVLAITPHHTYASTGITASNWGNWGNETVEFNLFEETKVRVAANCENFAQIKEFELKTKGVKGLLQDVITTATSLSVSTTEAQAVLDNNSSTEEQLITAANTLNEAVFAKKLENASESNPVDMTDYVTNPSFEDIGASTPQTGASYTATGWTTSGGDNNETGVRAATNSNQLAYRADGIYVFNIWKSGSSNTFSINQKISELPTGKYRVKALYYSDASNAITLYAGEASKGASTASGANSSTGVTATSNIYTHTGGDLEIGATSTAWFKVDGFKLEYLGEDISDYQEEYSNACTAAQAVDINQPMNTSDKTALETAISNYVDKEYTNIAAITAAISALKTATTNATNSIDAYVKAKDALDLITAEVENTNVYDATALATLNDKYQNGTLTNEEATNLKTYSSSGNSRYNNANAQVLLPGWKKGETEATTVGSNFYINSWSTEGNPADGKTKSGVVTPFFEYWTSDGNSLGTTNISKELSEIPNGYYKVDILTRFRIKNSGGASAKGITLSLNDNEDGQAYSEQGATCDDGAQFRYATLTAAAQVTNGSLKINFNVADGNNISWLAFKNVVYTQITEQEYSNIGGENLKSLLQEEMSKYEYVKNNIGDGAFQYAAANVENITSALEAANAVNDKENATVAEVNEQIEALKALTMNADLNAPAAGQKFNIVLNNNNGWSHDNKAITYLANDRADAGKYNIQYKAEVNANYAQAFTMTRVEGNKYKMSQLDNDGTERYISTGVPYSGNTSQIRTTTDAEKALVVEVIATAKEGVYNLKNTEANQYIGSQDAGVFTVNANINFNLVEAEKATATLKVTDAKYGTFIAPFDAEKPEGVILYTCDALGDNNVLTLEGASTIKANTPYIVYSESPVEEELSGWGLATKDTYTSGLLTGMYKSGSIEAGNYILQNQNGNVAFYIIAEGGYANGQANRCYLTVPEATSARLDIVIEGETGINDLGTENGVIADGKYMQNNKVVIVKNGRKYNVTGQIIK